jgi:hypothetical protein
MSRNTLMPNTVLSFDPESRPSALRALARLPWLAYRLVRWHALRGGWLSEYRRRRHRFDRRRFPPGQPIDVLVMFSDHYEPARRFGDEAAVESVRTWVNEYEALARPHQDADGCPPQHTWFYRYDYPNPGCVQELCGSAFRGFGEVEFHLHHGHDSHAAMAATLQTGLDWFNTFGAMRTAEARPRQRFGYVAGNSALDNGASDDRLSGCNTELWALRDAGCFADFTFPAIGTPAQPRTTNTIYYATEDGRPRSYDTGVPVAVGRPPSGDLMIFQGPVAVDWGAGLLEDASLENSYPAHAHRLRNWLSAHVHVEGRPEWVFVKLSTHAMQNRASFLGAPTDATLSAMEYWWNRPPFRLHYVAAREAYNVVKAAEAGHCGNPNDYRDFLIPPPANRLYACNRPWRLVSHTSARAHVRVLGEGEATLACAQGGLARVTGRLREVELRYKEGQAGQLAGLRLEGEGPFTAALRDGTTLRLPGGWWRPGQPALAGAAGAARSS